MLSCNLHRDNNSLGIFWVDHLRWNLNNISFSSRRIRLYRSRPQFGHRSLEVLNSLFGFSFFPTGLVFVVIIGHLELNLLYPIQLFAAFCFVFDNVSYVCLLFFIFQINVVRYFVRNWLLIISAGNVSITFKLNDRFQYLLQLIISTTGILFINFVGTFRGKIYPLPIPLGMLGFLSLSLLSRSFVSYPPGEPCQFHFL